MEDETATDKEVENESETPLNPEEQSEDMILETALAAVSGDDGSDGTQSEPETETEPEPRQKKEVDVATKDDDAGEKDAQPHERAWSAIRRKEKEIVDARAELTAERERIHIEREQHKTLAESVRKMQADIRSDPLGFIRRNGGYSMEDLVRLSLGDSPQPQQETQQPKAAKPNTELDELKAQISELRGLMVRRDQDRLIDEYRGSIRKTLEDPKYELLKSFAGYREDGSIMSAAEAIEHRASISAAQGEKDLTPESFADRLLSEYKETLIKLDSHGAARLALLGEDGTNAPSHQARSGGESVSRKKPTSLTNSLAASSRRPRPDKTPAWDDEDALLEDALRAMKQG